MITIRTMYVCHVRYVCIYACIYALMVCNDDFGMRDGSAPSTQGASLHGPKLSAIEHNRGRRLGLSCMHADASTPTAEDRTQYIDDHVRTCICCASTCQHLALVCITARNAPKK